MSSITIHNIDNDLDTVLRSQAKEMGMSLNKLVKNKLREVFSLEKKKKKNDFSEFFGVWTTDDFKNFEKMTDDCQKIDIDEWK